MNTGIFEMMSDCWHSHTDWNGINRKYYSGSYKAGDEDSSDDTRFGYTKENCWEAIRAALLFCGECRAGSGYGRCGEKTFGGRS